MCKNWVILGSVPETSHGEGSSPKRAAAWWRRLNGSILWRIMGETSDYDLKPLQLQDLIWKNIWMMIGFLNEDLTFWWPRLWKKNTTLCTYTHIPKQAVPPDSSAAASSHDARHNHGLPVPQDAEASRRDGKSQPARCNADRRLGKCLGSELLFSMTFMETWDNTPNKILA